MNNYEIDIAKLRSDLIDYFGSAMFSGLPMAIVNLSDVEVANPQKLVEIALKNGFDLNKYLVEPEEPKFKF